jgi:hypothetical protein
VIPKTVSKFQQQEVKGKIILYRTGQALRFSRDLDSQISRHWAHECEKVDSPSTSTSRLNPSPNEIFLIVGISAASCFTRPVYSDLYNYEHCSETNRSF